MAKLNLSKKDLINELNNGKVIRKTSGIWNTPSKSGRICTTVEDLEKFYDWAYMVDVYEGFNEGIDYDLVGASGCDMF